MGYGEYNTDTPRHLLQFEHSPANSSSRTSSNNTVPSPDTNCSSLNSTSTCSTAKPSINRQNIDSFSQNLELQHSSSNQQNQNVNDLNSYDGDHQNLCVINTLGNSNKIDISSQIIEGNDENEEFLPICDALFNVICLTTYFCDVVFDILSTYTSYENGHLEWSLISLILILLSLIMSQLVSFHWFRQNSSSISPNKDSSSPNSSSSFLVIIHLCLCGVLWRYFKLFIPVDPRRLKSEVRDLCLLRLIHAFCESGPILLLQLYFIFNKSSFDQISDLTKVSTFLSIFTICWALASYSKNVRKQSIHKLVLTWLGIIFQFLWRFGTVTSRVLALGFYSAIYSYWILLVLLLHWFSMLLWLLLPKNIFHNGEKKYVITKKLLYSAIVAFVYIFCFINVQEGNSRIKILLFYVIMFLENSLLVTVSLITIRYEHVWYRDFVLGGVFGGFSIGIFFLLIYYQYFHVKKLKDFVYNEHIISLEGKNPVKIPLESGYCSNVGIQSGSNSIMISSENGNNSSILNQHVTNIKSPSENEFTLNLSIVKGKEGNSPCSLYHKMNGHHIHSHNAMPGVFNCRFNPAMKRKKKKPSSFIPPPPLTSSAAHEENVTSNELISAEKDSNPFWKKPYNVIYQQKQQCQNENALYPLGSHHSSTNDLLDIQRKTKGKKDHQLAQLKEIQLELQQGNLQKNHRGIFHHHVDEIRIFGNQMAQNEQSWLRNDVGIIPGTASSPIPNPMTKSSTIIPSNSHVSSGNELILDPNLYFNSSNDIDFSTETNNRPNYYETIVYDGNQVDHESVSALEYGSESFVTESIGSKNSKILVRSRCGGPLRSIRNHNGEIHQKKRRIYPKHGIFKSYKVSSDIESQISIPRSLSLPHQKIYRNKGRHFRRKCNPSTNSSSDGDVDSGGDEEMFPASQPKSYHQHPFCIIKNGGENGFHLHSGQLKRLSGTKTRRRQPETPL